MFRLTDEEMIELTWHKPDSGESSLSHLRIVAKAATLKALKQVYEWLSSPCTHISGVEYIYRYDCPECWASLKAEIAMMEKDG